MRKKIEVYELEDLMEAGPGSEIRAFIVRSETQYEVVNVRVPMWARKAYGRLEIYLEG